MPCDTTSKKKQAVNPKTPLSPYIAVRRDKAHGLKQSDVHPLSRSNSLAENKYMDF